MDVALRSLPLRAAAAAAALRPEIFLGGDLSFSTLVGFFFVFSGLTSYLAYHGEAWDDSTLSVGNFDASRGHFFKKRLVRLLPMLLISAVCQQCACVLWLFRRGVAEERAQEGAVIAQPRRH